MTFSIFAELYHYPLVLMLVKLFHCLNRRRTRAGRHRAFTKHPLGSRHFISLLFIEWLYLYVSPK